MHRYSLFGGCLHSALEIPGLPVSASPDETWRLTVVPGGAGSCGAMLGTEEVDPGCTVRLHQQPDGLRLSYDDTGCFDIHSNGRDIVWYPAAGASDELARLDVIGRVLATALHVSGLLPLHGSAVGIDGTAVAFVAPKTFGKSTLAFALANAGATFISDDTLPVEPSATPRVRPGVDHVKLWSDSARRLTDTDSLPRAEGRGKRTIVMQAMEPSARLPLGAVYLLTPTSGEPSAPAVRRDRLPAVPATLALVRHAKLGGLVGGVEAARLLDQAGMVAQSVPVYRLEIARDLDRLPDAVSEIIAWHTPGSQGGGLRIEHTGLATVSSDAARQTQLQHAAGRT